LNGAIKVRAKALEGGAKSNFSLLGCPFLLTGIRWEQILRCKGKF
jgi:hypothetical protein